MANYMLHGTLVVTIHDAENIVTQERKTGSAPFIIRKVGFKTTTSNNLSPEFESQQLNLAT